MRLYLTLADESLKQTAENINLILRAKNTNVLNLIIRDEDKIAVDITDSKIYFTVKEKTSQTDADAKLKKDITTHTYPASGETDITLSITDTATLLGNYIYSIKLKKSDATVYTLAEGTILFQQEIATRVD